MEGRSVSVVTINMRSIIADNIEEIRSACKKHHVAELYVFGSVVGEKFNDDSDVDFIANFGEMPFLRYADNYLDFCYQLEDVLNRKVDVVVGRTIKNPYFKKEVEKTRQLLFAA